MKGCPEARNSDYPPLVATLFAVVAGLLTLFLRKNRAHVRYWLWLMASVKFLVPFSILVAVGGLLGPLTTAVVAPTGLVLASDFSSFVKQIGEPFATTVPQLAMPPVQGSYANLIATVLSIVWGTGFVTLLCVWTLRWRRIRASVRKASPLDLPIGLPVKSSPAFGEPGVFGIFRPVLLLPDKILDCLTAREMESIVAHELCHVRRRDNLATVIHMAVEVVFWFHPLVWWLGGRLIEERERACDEEVLRTGGEPRVYAEGILKICELYLASPLACVAGVTGGDLKRRIEAIMGNHVVCRLNYAKKAILAFAAIAAVAGPIAIGILNMPQSRAQSTGLRFEVASIKPHKNDSNEVHRTVNAFPGGRLVGQDATLQQLIQHAYDVKPFQVSGGPGWVSTDGYDVEAKAEGNPSREQIRLMLRTLLEDRFRLKLRRENKAMGTYELTVTKGGAKLPPANPEACADPNKASAPEAGATRLPKCGNAWVKGDRSGLEVGGFGLAMADFARALTNAVGSVVVDKTGLTQKFDVRLEFSSRERLSMGKPGAPPQEQGDASGTSLFSAIERQLGLKLESAKGPVEVLVIERAERPSAN